MSFFHSAKKYPNRIVLEELMLVVFVNLSFIGHVLWGWVFVVSAVLISTVLILDSVRLIPKMRNNESKYQWLNLSYLLFNVACGMAVLAMFGALIFQVTSVRETLDSIMTNN
jgi:hypothetical protein